MPALVALPVRPCLPAISRPEMSRRGSRRAFKPTTARVRSRFRERLNTSLMVRQELKLPPQVAKAFVRDMKAFFKAKDQLKQDEIAARQRCALQQYQRPRD